MGFASIRGHQTVRRLLQRAVAHDRLPPCLLFTGPDWVGKRLTAVALAARINCESRPDPDEESADACGTCGACGRIARDMHPDVILIAPEESGAIKVDTIRGAVAQAAYRPFEGRRRVVIIDEADRMVGEAQNALLKTLEEPPPGSVFLLVTARPHQLLVTVRSRCPALRFGGVSAEDTAELLVTEHGLAREAARAAAVASDGSVGAALEAESDAYVEARDSAATALQALARARNPKQRLETAKTLVSARRGKKSSPAADRETLGRRLRAMAALLRDLQLVATGGATSGLAHADLESDLQALSRGFDAPRARQGFATVDRALHALSRNASPKVVVDWLALRL